MKDLFDPKKREDLIQYFDGDELAADVWLEKYALKSIDGKVIENSPIDMHKRMAKEFFRIDGKYKKLEKKKELLSEYGQERADLSEQSIFEFFNHFKYLIPQGSVMANLGNQKAISSLSNCVVLPRIYDSYGGILYTDQQLAQLFKRRCGVGIDISSLRPETFVVNNSAGSTSGAVSFMDRFSNTTREVAQNGRRGALMITMDIRHPDILLFIRSKQDLTKITGANISVKLSNNFMRAVKNDQPFMLQWPIESENPKVVLEVRAREIWDAITQCAYHTAEPGLIFWDRQHTYSTSSIYPDFENHSTNPCSEIAMQGGDSCRLMAINFYSLVIDPFTKKAIVDYEKLYEVAYEGLRLMDNLVDLELENIDNILKKIDSDPEPDYIKTIEKDTWELLRKNGKAGRRTGLGFTGLADAIAAMGLKYDSEEALLLIDAMMRIKLTAELDATIDMAIQRGSFAAFDPSVEKESDFISKMMYIEFPEQYERMKEFGRRNISFSTVAPTGTLSLLARTSSGIEPVYQLEYARRKKISVAKDYSEEDEQGDNWETYDVKHPLLEKWQTANPTKSIEESPYWNSTAQDINWEKRIEVQKIVQKYTTHSISSTVNLDQNIDLTIVQEIYFKAWESGLKGITVYRDQSRTDVLQRKKKLNDALPSSCPNCESTDSLRFQEGCIQCDKCGVSMC